MWLPGCLAGLEERACCRMGLGGHSWAVELTLDLGLEEAGEGDELVGVDFPGEVVVVVIREWLVCLSPPGTGMEEGPREPCVGSLRGDVGLGGVSTKAFLWNLGLS